jgi:hypothetical protein
MCRSGGRRCPSSRPRSRGGTRGRPAAGQPGDTTPASSTPPPHPAAVNIATGNATVGGQYTSFAGSVTVTPAGVTVTGTGTPSPAPTPEQAAAAQATAARAMASAREAIRAARESARHADAGDTVNVAGSGQHVAMQIGHVSGNIITGGTFTAQHAAGGGTRHRMPGPADERGDTRPRGQTVIGGQVGSVISGGTFTGPVVMGSAATAQPASPAGPREDTGPVILGDGSGWQTVVTGGIHGSVISGGTFTGPVSMSDFNEHDDDNPGG